MPMIEKSDNDDYYMPHHAVAKETSESTKVFHIVFNASAKFNSGVSLNDMLMTGPIIQDKLFLYLIHFRTFNYVISFDIEKMYH